MHILIVEDDDQNIADFKEHAEIFDDEKVTYKSSKNVAEALLALSEESFNGVIIDLDLEGDSDAGFLILDEIHAKYRLPMIVFSGNATRAKGKKYVLKSALKGSLTYTDILNEFYSFNGTGIMNILGKTGQLEQLIDRIFWENLYPKMNQWKKYAQEEDIEKHLLRYTISHFQEILEDGVKYFFPEEMYINPPINEEIGTGSILKKMTSEDFFIVMSPACDIQQGCDRLILLRITKIKACKEVIDKLEMIDLEKERFIDYVTKTPKEDQTKKEKSELSGKIKSAKNDVKNTVTGFINSPSTRYHYISTNENFSNSIIDFHDITTVMRENLTEYKKIMSITAPYLKDIQSRFSSYYGRQGSPDFDVSKIIEKCKEDLGLN